jgi:hypothetical protein
VREHERERVWENKSNVVVKESAGNKETEERGTDRISEWDREGERARERERERE